MFAWNDSSFAVFQRGKYQAHLIAAAAGIVLVKAILVCRVRVTRGVLEARMDKAVENILSAISPSSSCDSKVLFV